MKFKFVKKDSRLHIFMGLHEIQVYVFPIIRFKKGEYAIYLGSGLAWKPQKDMYWKYAAFIRVLGFGLGYAYNHIENPNYNFELSKTYNSNHTVEEV